jgi:hypothetical protein
MEDIPEWPGPRFPERHELKPTAYLASPCALSFVFSLSNLRRFLWTPQFPDRILPLQGPWAKVQSRLMEPIPISKPLKMIGSRVCGNFTQVKTEKPNRDLIFLAI